MMQQQFTDDIMQVKFSDFYLFVTAAIHLCQIYSWLKESSMIKAKPCVATPVSLSFFCK
jgi:hypothetical protein